MDSDGTLTGVMTQGDTPSWTALEELLDEELLGSFMWMFEVRLEDGTRLNAYKHRMTRRYFHLADDGRAFYYVSPSSYCEVDRPTAIRAVFRPRKVWRPTKAEETALRESVRRARANPA
jgi:hypothetical protein